MQISPSVLLGAIAALCATVQPAGASANDDACRIDYRPAARAAFDEARYSDAIKSYGYAWRCDSKPKYLFNLALAHQMLAQRDKNADEAHAAVAYFQWYLRDSKKVTGTDPGDRPDVEREIERLRTDFPGIPTNPEAPIPDALPTPRVEAPPPVPVTPIVSPGLEVPTPSWLTPRRKAGVALLGVGAAIAGATAISGSLLWDAQSDYYVHCSRFPASKAGCADTVDRYNLLQGLTIGGAVLGGLSLVAGVTLLALPTGKDTSTASSQSKVSIVVGCGTGPGQVGIACSGTF